MNAPATETDRELDRLWEAIDRINGRLDAGATIPPPAAMPVPPPQHAPAPDYRLHEPPVTTAPACSCEEALELRERIRRAVEAMSPRVNGTPQTAMFQAVRILRGGE